MVVKYQNVTHPDVDGFSLSDFLLPPRLNVTEMRNDNSQLLAFPKGNVFLHYLGHNLSLHQNEIITLKISK